MPVKINGNGLDLLGGDITNGDNISSTSVDTTTTSSDSIEINANGGGKVILDVVNESSSSTYTIKVPNSGNTTLLCTEDLDSLVSRPDTVLNKTIPMYNETSKDLEPSSIYLDANGLLKGTAITQSKTDTTIGRLLKVGDFGLGDTSVERIGVVGSLGFGVGACKTYPSNLTPMFGYSDVTSPNYGNLTTANGSVFVCIPKFWYKWVGNVLSISETNQAGYSLPRAFINNGVEVDAFYRSKYHLGAENGFPVSKKGFSPLSTNSAHNPTTNVTGISTAEYASAYGVCKKFGNNFHPVSLFQEYALFLISYAQGKAGTNCAYADVAPFLPKGNNNNALADANDASVTFTSDGYLACALTGSGSNFAKTTHNGQNCGVADVNGNMWRVCSGLTRAGTTSTEAIQDTNGTGAFFILKESFDIAKLSGDWIGTATDSKTAFGNLTYLQGANSPYEQINISHILATPTSSYLGNGTNQVFGFSTVRTDVTYKWSNCGISNATGRSASGTTEFGNDGFYEMHRSNLCPLVGGGWVHTSASGFWVYLGDCRSYSGNFVGVCASSY